MKTFLILLLSISTSNVFSCGWFPSGEEFRFSIFQSNLAGHPDAYQLFYSAYFLNSYRPIQTTGPQENMDAWKRHLGMDLPETDIDKLVYRSSIEELSDLKARKGTGFDKFGNNKMYKSLSKKERSPTIDYLIFARHNENLLNVSDRWGELNPDTEALKSQLEIGLSLIDRSPNKELKTRYAYQCVVLARYIGGEGIMKTGIEVYKKHLTKVNHVLKYWALLHKAYMESTLGGSYEKFVIDYATVFRNCDSKKSYIALQSIVSVENVEVVLAHCTTNQQKAAVLALTAFRNPGKALETIKKIYQYDPTSPLLGILLIREVNKLEDWYLTEKHSGYEPAVYFDCWRCKDKLAFIKAKNFYTDKLYLKEVTAFVEKLDLQKTLHRSLYKTVEAYLLFMVDDPDRSSEILNNLIAQDKPMIPSLEGQVRAIQLLLSVSSESVDHKEIMKHIKWLDSHQKSIYNYEKFRSQLFLALARKFEYQDNIAMAALCMVKVTSLIDNAYGVWGDRAYFFYMDESATANDVNVFITLTEQKGNDEFVDYCSKSIRNNMHTLYDLLGTKYLREDKLELAYEKYKSIPDSFWHTGNYPEMLDCDPFYSEYYERHSARENNETFTKKEFVDRLIELKRKAATEELYKAYYYFQLGNAYFNMTKYGNSWYYVHYGWSAYDSYDPKYYEDEYYYSCSRANDYYMKAYEESKDSGYAALCLRMAAKCAYYQSDHQHKQKVRSTGSWDDRKDMTKLKHIYRKLQNEFPNHYDNLVRTCSFFEMYLDRWRYS